MTNEERTKARNERMADRNKKRMATPYGEAWQKMDSITKGANVKFNGSRWVFFVKDVDAWYSKCGCFFAPIRGIMIDGNFSAEYDLEFVIKGERLALMIDQKISNITVDFTKDGLENIFNINCKAEYLF